MAASIEEITKEIVGLPRHQRLALVRLLLDLDRLGTGEEVKSAWDEEGRAVGIPYGQIKKEMTDRFPSR